MAGCHRRTHALLLMVSIVCTVGLVLSSCDFMAGLAGRTYRVTYEGMGHTGGNVPFDDSTYKAGDTVVVRGPGTMVRDFVPFDRWEVGGEGGIGTGVLYAEGDRFAMPDHDVTLWARWLPAYPVMYEPNDSTTGTLPGPHATYYAVGATVTVLGNSGGLAGPFVGSPIDGIRQRFVRWSTAADGTGHHYVGGDTFVMPSESVWLWATYTTDSGRVRKVGPGGGWVFYHSDIPHSWGSSLEAWNADEPTTYRWKNTNTATVEADGVALGEGHGNTYLGMVGVDHPAASRARFVSYGGMTDWYLPAHDELHEMLTILAIPGHGSFTGGNFYWSSSQVDDVRATAVLYHLGDLLTESRDKVDLHRVRVIRRFGAVAD